MEEMVFGLKSSENIKTFQIIQKETREMKFY